MSASGDDDKPKGETPIRPPRGRRRAIERIVGPCVWMDCSCCCCCCCCCCVEGREGTGVARAKVRFRFFSLKTRLDRDAASYRSERNESHDDDVRVRTETPGRRARASSRETRLEARASVRRFGRRDALGARARRGHSTRSASQSSRRSPEVSREGAFVPSRRSRRGSWSRRGCRTCARRARAWAGARRRGSWWRRGTCWGEDVGGCRGRAGARVNWRHHREPCRCFRVPASFPRQDRENRNFFSFLRASWLLTRGGAAPGRAQRPTRAGDGRA